MVEFPNMDFEPFPWETDARSLAVSCVANACSWSERGTGWTTPGTAVPTGTGTRVLELYQPTYAVLEEQGPDGGAEAHLLRPAHHVNFRMGN